MSICCEFQHLCICSIASYYYFDGVFIAWSCMYVLYCSKALAWEAAPALTSSSKHISVDCVSCHVCRRLLCFDPQERLETEGEPVPVRGKCVCLCVCACALTAPLICRPMPSCSLTTARPTSTWLRCHSSPTSEWPSLSLPWLHAHSSMPIAPRHQ